MSSNWLASADPGSAWAHRAWSEFADLPERERERVLVVLPVHGFADHGMGLPLDAEEIVGSAALRTACSLVGETVTLRVLPPLRFALAPYPSTFFGIDPETAHAIAHELAASVHAAGFRRLVFLTTSPWNATWVDAVAVDVRVALGLHTFVLRLGGLGLDFHPGAAGRADTQAVAAHLLACTPASATRAPDVRDPGLRPVQYRQPPPVEFNPHLDGAALLAAAGARCAGVLREMAAHRLEGAPAKGNSQPAVHPPRSDPWPASHRGRYLPAMTRDALEALPHKDRALVILPLGSIEQHGHHLPVGVDAILAQVWLEHALAKLAPAAPVYVAPSIAYGKSNEHTGFPGTLSLSATTLRRLLLALAHELHALGFRQLAVLNTHGGNSAVLEYTLREIQRSPGLRAGVLRNFHTPAQTPQETAYGFHAGQWETALMLACAPEWVRMDRAVCEYPARIDEPGELRPEGSAARFAWLTRDISKSGVMGNAPAASAEMGHQWLEEASTALAARISSLLDIERSEAKEGDSPSASPAA